MKRVLPFAFLLLPFALLSQHQHPASAPQPPAAQSAEAGHHACLAQERAAIANGEGFGMALAADRSGYPGPKHILELKTELKLTREQEAAIEKIRAEMKEKALARGREVLLAEERLEELFRQQRPEAELREEAFRAASLRVELRWTHLAAHLAARQVLNAEQLAAYHRLRYDAAPHAH
jgi:Spy/CpxP family protein refolding chaperone